jgi:hypothetical protein
MRKPPAHLKSPTVVREMLKIHDTENTAKQGVPHHVILMIYFRILKSNKAGHAIKQQLYIYKLLIELSGGQLSELLDAVI